MSTSKAKGPVATGAAAKKLLAGMMAEYLPAIATSAKKILAVLRPMFKGADEMVYDYPVGLVIAFSPTGRGKDGIASIVLYPKWINLFLLNGPTLPDPTKRLQGAGTAVRHITLDDGIATLREKDVQALIKSAIKASEFGLDAKRKGQLVIQVISPNKRPRRPVEKASSRKPASVARSPRRRGRT
ncbi:MAG TPA: hypothetical protein VGM90_04090 [Kofleriaceae bacterium]|jgi:hypothetical protein